MIDWLTVVIPLKHRLELAGNITSQTTPDGELKWISKAPKRLKGSYESSVSIRSEGNTGDHFTHLYVHGNLVKFFQGHNVFGSMDIRGLLQHFLLRLPHEVDLQLLESPVAHLDDAELKRIDIAFNYSLANVGEVNAWLAAAEIAATFRYRGRGIMSTGTLYFGKSSRRSSIKFYAKGKELRAHKLHQRVADKRLLTYAEPLLRSELTLRTMQLKEHRLATVRQATELGEAGQLALYDRYLSGLALGECDMKTIDYQDGLTPAEQRFYQSWLDGYDLREKYSKAMYYRHKKALYAKLKINVAIPNTKELKKMRFPVIEFIVARAAPIPDWAIGTDLYFEPGKLKVA